MTLPRPMLNSLGLVCFALFALAGCEQSPAEPVGEREREAPTAPDAAPAAGDGAELAVAAEANNRFALALLDRLRGEEQGNLFYSPSSLSTALAMAYAGARGETAAEMADALQFEDAGPEIHSATRALLTLLKQDPQQSGYQLAIANRLWGQAGFEFRPEFLQTTAQDYGAKLATVDFKQPEQARGEINRWVAEATQDKIEDLIPTGVLDRMTRLVLTNAIYFKGKWEHPFDPDATQPLAFHTASGDQVQAETMFQHTNFNYGQFDGLQVVELPYAGDALSMVVLLPAEDSSLAALVEQWTPEKLEQWIGRLKSEKVQLYLPKFEITAQFELAAALEQLGMQQAFDPDSADFSGISSEAELFLSAVVHQAFVEVNEEGREAAAATGLAFGVTSAPAKPIVFRADRPFFFLIRDQRSGAILFLGQVVDPS